MSERLPNRLPHPIEATMMGADPSFLFQIGRTDHGEVAIVSKFPVAALTPKGAKEFAAKLVKAAERIERGEVPMKEGREGG